MAMSGLPEPLRARMAELDARSALDTVRDFLSSDLADAGSLDGLRADLRRVAQTSTLSIRQDLAALEALLAGPPLEPGALTRLVAWEGNWVLDDLTDAGAAAFLRSLADLLREVIDEAE